MAEAKNGGGGAGDALPMKKASPMAFLGAGAGVLVIGGLVAFAMGGENKSERVEKAAATEKAADKAQGMTKAEFEEQQAHLKRTQAAIVAAEAEEQATTRAAQQAAAARQAEAEAEAADKRPAPKASSAPKKSGNPSKSMEGLDALGDDITSALK